MSLCKFCSLSLNSRGSIETSSNIRPRLLIRLQLINLTSCASFGAADVSFCSQADIVFWLGDLNYRIVEEVPDADVLDMIQNGNLEELRYRYVRRRAGLSTWKCSSRAFSAKLPCAFFSSTFFPVQFLRFYASARRTHLLIVLP